MTLSERTTSHTPARRSWRVVWSVCGALLIALCFGELLVGCAADRGAPSRPQDDSVQRTTALVSMAVGFHKRADIALLQKRRDDAKAELSKLLVATERADLNTPEAHDVRFDAAARLARLYLEDDALDKAEAVARDGLKREDLAPPSLFRGYLHQALAEILEKQGDLRGAVDEHGVAIAIFQDILNANAPPQQQRATPPQP